MAFGKVTPKATTFISQGWDAFNTFIDDLLSIANGKGASQVGVEDAAGNMAATNVEDALAELYSDTATTITLAETFDENTSATTGLTWGYKGGLFRLDAVVTTVVAGTIGLTDDATNYVEIDPSDGNVKKNTTAFTSGRIPIRIVTTVSGEQTVSTDKRAWFSQVAAATTSTSGIMELATDAEAIAGTAGDRVLTPSNLTAVLPTGIITMWSGAISDLEAPWFLCDGTNGTPNLTDRFVLPADADSGGTNDVGDIGGGWIHDHTGPSHNHGITVDNHTLLVTEIPAHDHNVNGFASGSGPASLTLGGFDTGVVAIGTSSTGSGTGHNHTASSVNDGTGATGTGSNVPKYYALAYIMLSY